MGATWPLDGTLSECCTRIGLRMKDSLHILLFNHYLFECKIALTSSIYDG